MKEKAATCLESTWQERETEDVQGGLITVRYCLNYTAQKLARMCLQNRQITIGNGVAETVHYCALRHCALFYVRYYRLGAAGDDGRFGKRGDLLNTNKRSSIDSKVPPHYTTARQHSAQRGRRRFYRCSRGRRRYFLHIKALRERREKTILM